MASKAHKAKGRDILSKDDWLRVALEELNDRGVDAVKVLPLSKALGVTRGSFYWHFEDRNDLLKQMLDYWERELTDEVIVHASAIDGSPEQKLRDVMENVLLNRQDRYDTAIAGWGMGDRHAANVHARVLRKRIRFLHSLLTEAGIASEDADFRARLVFGFLISSTQGNDRRTRAQRLDDVERLLALLLA